MSAGWRGEAGVAAQPQVEVTRFGSRPGRGAGSSLSVPQNYRVRSGRGEPLCSPPAGDLRGDQRGGRGRTRSWR